jgi:hypothetical protein
LLAVFLTLTYFWFEYPTGLIAFERRGFHAECGNLFRAETLKAGEAISLEDLTKY